MFVKDVENKMQDKEKMKIKIDENQLYRYLVLEKSLKKK